MSFQNFQNVLLPEGDCDVSEPQVRHAESGSEVHHSEDDRPRTTSHWARSGTMLPFFLCASAVWGPMPCSEFTYTVSAILAALNAAVLGGVAKQTNHSAGWQHVPWGPPLVSDTAPSCWISLLRDRRILCWCARHVPKANTSGHRQSFALLGSSLLHRRTLGSTGPQPLSHMQDQQPSEGCICIAQWCILLHRWRLASRSIMRRRGP